MKFEGIAFIELSEKTYDELEAKLVPSYRFKNSEFDTLFPDHLMFLTLEKIKFGVFRKQPESTKEEMAEVDQGAVDRLTKAIEEHEED